MTLSEMFVDQEEQTFEMQRDQVISIILAATDLGSTEERLQSYVQRLSAATDEKEFDDAYADFVDCLSTAPASHRVAVDHSRGSAEGYRRRIGLRRGHRQVRASQSDGRELAFS
jgi:hypothetical protein